MSNPEVVIAADIGSTSIHVGAVTAQGVAGQESVSTPDSPEKFYQLLAGTVGEYSEAFNSDVVVMGFPGKVERKDGRSLVGPMPNVAGFPEPVDIAEGLASADARTQDLKTLVLNDAEIGVHYLPTLLDDEPNETWLFYVVHGTGLGVDGIRYGQTLRDHGLLMEVGHNPFMYQRPRHDSVGNPVLKRKLPEVRIETIEDRVSGKAIMRRNPHGDSMEEAINHMSYSRWQFIGRDLGRGLCAKVSTFGMSHIVIGGRVSRAHHLYESALREQFDRSFEVMPEHLAPKPEIQFVPEELVDKIGLLGAYRAAKRRGLIS